MKRDFITATAASALTLLLGGVGAVALADTGEDGSTIGPATVTVTVPVGSLLGPCSVVTPPMPGPCELGATIIRDVVIPELFKGVYNAKWEKDNPGEKARLAAHMANPQCQTSPSPGSVQGLVQDMKTHYGAAMFALTEVFACLPEIPPGSNWQKRPLYRVEPDPPLDPKRTDKIPPTSPGPVTVTPAP